MRSDREAFTDRIREPGSIDLGASGSGEGDLARVALALHHAYGAVESLLARVARTLKGSVPEGADWHHALLTTMALDIEGVRPRVLRSDTVARLLRLLAFRHFIRHAYAVGLDRDRLEVSRKDAVDLAPPLAEDLDRLDRFLEELAREE